MIFINVFRNFHAVHQRHFYINDRNIRRTAADLFQQILTILRNIDQLASKLLPGNQLEWIARPVVLPEYQKPKEPQNLVRSILAVP